MGSSILSSLDEEATWEDAKESLFTRLRIGSVRDEAWAALKNLKKGSKDIVELAGKAEKLAKRLHPRDKEAAERHAVDAFLGALDRTLAAEVQKLGHRTMEEVVEAAWRIEKIPEEQTDTKMEFLVNTMQDQLRILYQDYSEEPPFYRPPHRQMDRRLPRCFLCGEGHFVSNCPTRPVLQRLLRQQARASAHGPPRGQILELPHQEDDSHSNPNKQLKLLEGSPEAKMTTVGCAVGPPITGQLNLEGIPVFGLVDTGASVTCMGFSVW